MRHQTRLTRISTIVLALYFCAGCGNKAPSFSSREEVQQAARMAVHHLVGRSTKSGMFIYCTNLNPEVVVAPGYNILRHAGTIYAMAMYNGTYPDERVQSAMLEAGRYLQKEALFPVPGSGNLFAIWSRPEVNKTGTPLQAKLGGTGLGLVSLLSIEAVQPGFMPMDQLRGMGRFVLYMQKPEGNFHSKYIPATGGLDDQWESLFYPGEAALGLAMLYEKDPDPLWLEGALKALTFLAHNRRDAQSVPEDHWALLATERLFLFQKPLITDELGQLLLGHADQICRSMLTRYEKGRKPGNRQGRILQDLSVTQVSCTLEGLLAALSIFPQNHVLRPRLENTAKEGVTFLLGTQISQGDEKGAFPRNDLASHSMGCGQGRIDPRNAELRIDYTQHALSALVRYLKLGEE